MVISFLVKFLFLILHHIPRLYFFPYYLLPSHYITVSINGFIKRRYSFSMMPPSLNLKHP